MFHDGPVIMLTLAAQSASRTGLIWYLQVLMVPLSSVSVHQQQQQLLLLSLEAKGLDLEVSGVLSDRALD